MPPQPNSPSSVCGARTSARCQALDHHGMYITLHAARRRARIVRHRSAAADARRGRRWPTMTHVAAVLGALGIAAPPRPEPPGPRPRGLGLIALAEAAARPGRAASRPRGAARGSRCSRSSASLRRACFVRRPELVPARDPRRRAAADAARLRRRAPLLRRPRRRTARSAACSRSTASSSRPRSRSSWRLVREPAPTRRPLPREIALPLGALVAFASLSRALVDAPTPRRRTCCSTSCSPSRVLVAVVGALAVPAPGCRARSASTASRWRRSSRVVGLVEEATQRLIFYTPSVQIGNAYSSFFRVTSLFRDPSLYGRQIVLAMAIVLTALWYRKIGIAAGRARDRVPLRRPLLLVLAVEPRRALRRRGVHLASSPAIGPSRLVAAITAVRRARGRRRFVADKVGGRLDAARHERPLPAHRPDGEGVRHHPLAGVGLGSQPQASQAVSKNGGPPSLFVSHTTPLTVAAELGIVGLAPLRRAARRRSEGAPARAFRLDTAFGLALASVFARPVRALAVLQRLLRGSRHLARARGRLELPRARAPSRRASRPRERRGIDRRRRRSACSASLGGARRGRTCPGSAPTRGRSDRRRPRARPARPARPRRRRHWDLGVVRTPAVLAGRARRGRRRRRLAGAARGARWVLVAALRRGGRAAHRARDAAPGRPARRRRRRGST